MLTNPVFLTVQVLNSLALGMNLFIVAAGLTLIFGVLRVINFAHGAFYMFGAYVLFTMIGQFGATNLVFWLAVVAAALVLAVIGFIIERFLLSRLYDKEHLLQLLFTFAIVLILGDIAKMIWGSEQHSVSYPPMFSGAVDLGIVQYPVYLIFLMALGPIIAISMWLIIEKTRWGRIIRAATMDREMLSALGANVKVIYSLVFVSGAALAGLGGALAAPRLAVEPGMDTSVIIECFIIVIIGGLGSLWGSFLGAIILGLVTMLGSAILPEFEMALTYAMMVVVLLWRPWGLLGKPETDRH